MPPRRATAPAIRAGAAERVNPGRVPQDSRGSSTLSPLLDAWLKGTGLDEEDLRSSSGEGLRWQGPCTECGGSSLVMSYQQRRGRPSNTTLVRCWACGAGLMEVCATLGVEPWRAQEPIPEWDLIVEAIRSGLDRWRGARGQGQGQEREPEDPPTEEQISAWQENLRGSPKARRFLKRYRGLTTKTIARYRLGSDGRTIIIPVFDPEDSTRPVNRYRRSPKSGRGPKYLGLAGRTIANGGITLYPRVPTRPDVVVCSGLLDALIARQKEFDAVTGTGGCGTWPEEWCRWFVGRRVAVCFDVGEEVAAARVVTKLRAVGAVAWAVNLGLGPKEDLTDFFVKHGRTATELRDLINAARPRPRRRSAS